MLRRILAITLLIAFGSPLVAPLLAATAEAQSSLPACCRMHGRHHCTMPSDLSGASSDPALEAPPCPLYPAAATVPLSAAAIFAAPPQLALETTHKAAPRTPLSRRAQNTSIAAHPKRGPPTQLT